MIGDPKQIDAFPEASRIDSSTPFVVQQDGAAKKMLWGMMMECAKDIFLSGGVPYGKELTESWGELKARIKAGDFTGIHIGDYKTIQLTTGETVIMEVAGIDQYYECGNTSIGHHIDFISRDCLKDTKVFNTSGKNNGTEKDQNPWRASELFQEMNDETSGVFSTLPVDLKPCIIDKLASIEARYFEGEALKDSTGMSWNYMGKLWLPTEREVWGSSVCSDPIYTGGGCNKQYPIFFGGTKHVIKGNGNGGSRANWWEANARQNDFSTMCFVSGFGNASSYYAANAARVPLCFRIG